MRRGLAQEMKEPTYIGDSVYAEINDNGQLVLWLDNGYGRKNEIILEPETWLALCSFAIRKAEGPGDE